MATATAGAVFRAGCLIMGDMIRRTPHHRATVTAVVELTPRMRRVTLTGDSLRGLTPNPAQDAELIFTESSGRKLRRRYTIRHARPDAGEWDLDVLLHGSGPGSDWAARVEAGAPIEFFAPRGRIELAAADWHLLVGDESALPAIAALAEAAPASAPVLAVVEVEGPEDRLPLATPHITWCHRSPLRPGTPDLLGPAITALRPPPGQGQAYLLGESRTVVALREAVATHGIGVENSYVKGYWNHARGR
jgi:NADPH-dependent ferric siderophore reductase